MSDYRLTREFVRREFIFGAMEYSPRITELFDRWLAEELAEAWEEGHEAAAMRVPEGVWHDTASPRTPNPYRQEQDT